MERLVDYIRSLFAFDANSPLLFTQFQFWAFFVILFAGFALLHNRRLLRNSYLFFLSLLFYYKTSGLFVGLLIFVTCSDFLLAQGIHRLLWKGQPDGMPNPRHKRRALGLLCTSVIIDLGLLCYFKYSYFFTDVANQLFGTQMVTTNVAADWGNSLIGSNFFNADRIILPVGISFYTFQIISYTADVYRGLVRPVRNLLDFGFYVSFFPQLVAGPIVKASDFIPQLYRRFHLGRMQFGLAIFWILNGLVKKVVLSDYLAVNFVDRVFDNPHLFGAFENLSALFCYSLQIYADFSGYTDMAIGLAMLMGFYLPTNFNSPYKSPNASNFWKRWHISLSRWLQTYLYIPLGGNRRVSVGTLVCTGLIPLLAFLLSGSVWLAVALAIIMAGMIGVAWRFPGRHKHLCADINAMLTMLLGGMWHGASLNFIVWGGLHGTAMAVYKWWRDLSLFRRALWPTLLTAVCYLLRSHTGASLWVLLFYYALFIALCAWVRLIYRHLRLPAVFAWLERSWAILVTFVFVTFTWLFFRSGSNLDPAEANQAAWNTAGTMIDSIATKWNVPIWDVVSAYRTVFILFLLGMTIHWLPTQWKRRYRLCFARLPLPLMALAVVAVVFICYQFMSAEMQPFIYFQF